MTLPLIRSLRRRSLLAGAALLAAFSAAPALAQAPVTPIKFQLDWRFEGPAALFLASSAKGYYKEAGLNGPKAFVEIARKGEICEVISVFPEFAPLLLSAREADHGSLRRAPGPHQASPGSY